MRRALSAERDEWERTLAALDEVLADLTSHVTAAHEYLAMRREEEDGNDTNDAK